jgi:signal transduction histidine kinase
MAIRPLEAEADAARRERDMVLSALETERSRLASAIHDGPLTDLALLTLQLDAAGDRQRAQLARSIAGDLRSLGNELRVPLLDDLGAGAAIEWLAGRISQRTQVDIETELAVDEHRPPAPVELAIFRVAQEAILNATKHGQGPVKVRYSSDQAATRLVVTDAGPGIAPSAQDVAARSGHLGLTLMGRRAEAIGARLEIRSLQDGGTQVDLSWPAT